LRLRPRRPSFEPDVTGVQWANELLEAAFERREPLLDIRRVPHVSDLLLTVG